MRVVEVDSMQEAIRDYTDLADLLWREREILEQLIVAAGQTRWLPMANRRLDSALEQLRATEVARSMESDDICQALGISTSASLAEVAELAPQPWDSILIEYREALLALADEVRVAADHNRLLLDLAARSVRETLASITASIGTYDATGASDAGFSRPSRLDEQA